MEAKTRQTLFYKGDSIYVLVSCTNMPSFVVPVKGIIKEIKHDAKNPKYLIKIVKFFDSWTTIKRFFIKNRFKYTFRDKSRRSKIEDVTSLEALYEKLNNPDLEHRYYIVVDSLMSFKSRGAMDHAFNEIQDFLIHKKLRDLCTYQIRGFYKGKYKVHNKTGWFKMARSIIDVDGDLTDEEFKKLMKSF